MKQIFTLLFSFMTIALVQAQSYQTTDRYRQGGSLSVSGTGARMIRVVVNGRIVSGDRQDNDEVYLSDLRTGYYSIKIFQQRMRGRRSGFGNDQMQEVYNSRVYIRPRTHIDIVINRFGRAFIDERSMNSGWGGWDSEWSDGNWSTNAPWNNSTNTSQYMDAGTFNSFLQTLRAESFDNTRQTIAKQTMSNQYFTTAQIREIVDVFTYENTKLEMAKYAYGRCVDKNNYFQLNQSLTYSSSREELSRYIQSYRD